MSTGRLEQSGTVGAAVAEATGRLERAGVPDARLDAELLLAHVLGTDRGGVVALRPDPLSAGAASRYGALIARRERREPLQHLTGVQEFYGLEISVDRRALIPRPETEGLVDALLNASLPEGARVLDLGTGSGCIAVALAVSRRDLAIDAVDLSTESLELARQNAHRHGVLERIDFQRADYRTLPADWHGRIDAVVSNPPYVSESEWVELEPEVRDHEPRGALVAGETGLEAYAAIAPVAAELLSPGGRLILELGFGQGARAREIVAAVGFERIELHPDLRGIERVLVAVKPEEGETAK